MSFIKIHWKSQTAPCPAGCRNFFNYWNAIRYWKFHCPHNSSKVRSVCPQCGATFSRKWSLTRHLKLHSSKGVWSIQVITCKVNNFWRNVIIQYLWVIRDQCVQVCPEGHVWRVPHNELPFPVWTKWGLCLGNSGSGRSTLKFSKSLLNAKPYSSIGVHVLFYFST